ncbi:ADP-ribosylation factor-like protein 13A [Aythya fuligula]|uniref:ADP-ribosylation factor-like protein 13A n=1 Tax=Aythya fuligula TaxID=219594 RepID=A0A6J3DLI6_AYTFU|nr:ADP-ribosylation factor-like protein 13A [Aythya fuligula]
MFHLFSHCWSWLQAVQEPIRKVTLLVVGLDNAGKSSVIMDIGRALACEVLPTTQPGQICLRVDRFEVTLVDLPGGQRFRSAWRSHYSTAHGLLFVLDSSDLARMEEARKALSRVLSHPDVSGKPLLLLANKQDVAAALLPCELIERLALERLVNENRSPCRIEPCAAAGPARSTLQGLRWLLHAAAERSSLLPATRSPMADPSPRTARGLCSRPTRDAPDNQDGVGKMGEHRAAHRLLPKVRAPPRSQQEWARLEGAAIAFPSSPPLPAQEESAKGPGKRKRKVKVRKKGLGQPSLAEEPDRPGGGGDSRASSAVGLLAPNRVGQEEPLPPGMAAPHPAQGMKKKKKKKIKNKIKSQEPAVEQQREEVSSTFDLYRRAMLALKMRQEQRKQPSAIAP